MRFPADGALEHFAGTAAYAFLLRFACGLESKLVAETEIFGQIKQAWRDFSEASSGVARQLSPWMQLLFQDAKAIRAQYLANLGSASYGSQVRRLLGEEAARQARRCWSAPGSWHSRWALADRRGAVALESHPGHGPASWRASWPSVRRIARCASSKRAWRPSRPRGARRARSSCACRPIPYAIRRGWRPGAAAAQPAAGWCTLAREPTARPPGATCPACQPGHPVRHAALHSDVRRRQIERAPQCLRGKGAAALARRQRLASRTAGKTSPPFSLV